jgi:hypothetical protein
MMADLVDILDADVIALQEVDGPEAARLIFDPAEYEFHFSSQNNPQRTGFAIAEAWRSPRIRTSRSWTSAVFVAAPT